MKSKLLVSVAVISLIVTPALAGQFGDAANDLEGSLQALEQRVLTLEDRPVDTQNELWDAIEQIRTRLDQLEARPAPDPDPDPDPGPEIVCAKVLPVEANQDPKVGTNHVLPVRIQAEDFDHGGINISYYDTSPGNAWGVYRPVEDVDVKVSLDTDGHYNVGLIKEGEWLEYTVCSEGGTFDVIFRVASNIQPNGGTMTLVIDGEEKGSFVTPYTGCWDNCFVNVRINGVDVRRGNQIVRINFSGAYQDINWFEFVPAGTAMNQPPTDLILCSKNPDGSINFDDCDEGHRVSTQRQGV